MISLTHQDIAAAEDSEDLFDDTGSVYDPETFTEEDIEQEVEDINDSDNEASIMPTTKTRTPAKKPPAKDKAVDDLTDLMGRVNIKNKLYSFTFKFPYCVKNFTKNENDYAEVEFLLPPCDDDCFKVDLAKDGTHIRLLACVPEMFGEMKRMKKQMKDKWTKNDPRVLAHSNAVQVMRKNDQAKSKKYWGEPQLVKLPFKCEGMVTKKWSYHKVGERVGTAEQYWLILSTFSRSATKRIMKEKTGKREICSDASEDSDDEDIDGSDYETENLANADVQEDDYDRML